MLPAIILSLTAYARPPGEWRECRSSGLVIGRTLGLDNCVDRAATGLQSPEPVLAFYCPIDYENYCKRFLATSFLFPPPAGMLTSKIGWKPSIYPQPCISSPSESYDVLEGIQDEPVSISPLSLSPNMPTSMTLE